MKKLLAVCLVAAFALGTGGGVTASNIPGWDLKGYPDPAAAPSADFGLVAINHDGAQVGWVLAELVPSKDGSVAVSPANLRVTLMDRGMRPIKVLHRPKGRRG